jgi:hypothetical protein
LARAPYLALVETTPITSRAPQLAATKAMPVTHEGSERPARRKASVDTIRRRRRQPTKRMAAR